MIKTIHYFQEILTHSTSAVSMNANESSVAPTSRKRKQTNDSSYVEDFLKKATACLDNDDDKCLTLARGYATKMRKLTTQQLMFADRLINEVLMEAQMGELTRHSYFIHPTTSVSTPIIAQSPSPENSVRDFFEKFNCSTITKDPNVILEFSE